MDKRILEAVELFHDVFIYGTERVLRSVDNPIWKEYSHEQIQVLNLLSKEKNMTSGRLATMQGVHKSAISNRTKKLLEKGLIAVVQSEDKREKVYELTELGRDVLQQSNAMVFEYVHTLLTDQVNDEEIDQFLLTFRKLKEILKMEEM